MTKISESPAPTENGQTLPLTATQTELLKSVKLQCLQDNVFYERLNSMLGTDIEPRYKELGNESESDYSKIIDNVFISKRTWNFISCVMDLHAVYDKFNEALGSMYGGLQGTKMIEDAFDKPYREIESEIYKYVNESINEYISEITLNKI